MEELDNLKNIFKEELDKFPSVPKFLLKKELEKKNYSIESSEKLIKKLKEEGFIYESMEGVLTILK